jgi:hypothetical protein
LCVGAYPADYVFSLVVELFIPYEWRALCCHAVGVTASYLRVMHLLELCDVHIGPSDACVLALQFLEESVLC